MEGGARRGGWQAGRREAHLNACGQTGTAAPAACCDLLRCPGCALRAACLWEVMTPQPASLLIFTAWMDSVRLPIWLTCGQ